ncbi:hypothetical protein AMECASPLE_000539 [Ameca splendens]|uniref:Uncharacterized protein n=1 Tax=Ameca splendens TaxID=208324 RepID=A0ABV0XLW9_9TELE
MFKHTLLTISPLPLPPSLCPGCLFFYFFNLPHVHVFSLFPPPSHTVWSSYLLPLFLPFPPSLSVSCSLCFSSIHIYFFTSFDYILSDSSGLHKLLISSSEISGKKQKE